MTHADAWLYIAIMVVLLPAGAFVIRTCIEMLVDLWKGKDDED
jgi:hypothetical protein